MHSELEMVRSTAPSVDVSGTGILTARKRMNESCHALVHDAILKNDLTILSEKLAVLMTDVSRTLLGLGVEPDLENFAYGCAELVGVVRKTMDDALRFSNLDDFKLGSVMAEVVIKGICATLCLPLDKLMAEVLAAEVEGRAPDIGTVLNKAKESA